MSASARTPAGPNWLLIFEVEICSLNFEQILYTNKYDAASSLWV